MFRIASLILLAGLMSTDAASAQSIILAGKGEPDAKAAPPSQRYRFSHTAEGVLRLDSQTGQVVLCRPQGQEKGQGWACDAAPEKSAAAQDDAKSDAKRMDDEFETLKAQLTQLQNQLGAPADDNKDKAHADAIAQLRTDNAALKGEIAALTAQLAALDKKAVTQDVWQSMVARLALLEQDNGGMKGALMRLEREKKELETQLDARAATAAQAQQQAQKESQDQIRAQSAEIAGLKEESARLQDSVASLQKDAAVASKQLAELMPPPPPVPPAPVPPENNKSNDEPSHIDLDRARALIADAWRRTVEMIENLRRDMTRKNDSIRL